MQTVQSTVHCDSPEPYHQSLRNSCEVFKVAFQLHQVVSASATSLRWLRHLEVSIGSDNPRLVAFEIWNPPAPLDMIAPGEWAPEYRLFFCVGDKAFDLNVTRETSGGNVLPCEEEHPSPSDAELWKQRDGISGQVRCGGTGLKGSAQIVPYSGRDTV